MTFYPININYSCQDQQQQQQQQPLFHTGQPMLAGTSSWEQEDFAGAKFYCPHAHADSNQHIWIREKTLEFSSTVLFTLSLCCILLKINRDPKFVLDQYPKNFSDSCLVHSLHVVQFHEKNACNFSSYSANRQRDKHGLKLHLANWWWNNNM